MQLGGVKMGERAELKRGVQTHAPITAAVTLVMDEGEAVQPHVSILPKTPTPEKRFSLTGRHCKLYNSY